MGAGPDATRSRSIAQTRLVRFHEPVPCFEPCTRVVDAVGPLALVSRVCPLKAAAAGAAAIRRRRGYRRAGRRLGETPGTRRWRRAGEKSVATLAVAAAPQETQICHSTHASDKRAGHVSDRRRTCALDTAGLPLGREALRGLCPGLSRHAIVIDLASSCGGGAGACLTRDPRPQCFVAGCGRTVLRMTRCLRARVSMVQTIVTSHKYARTP